METDRSLEEDSLEETIVRETGIGVNLKRDQKVKYLEEFRI